MTQEASQGAPNAPAAGGDAAALAAAQAAAKPSGSESELLIGDEATGKPAAPDLSTEPKGPVVIEFNATGDAGLDMALGFIGKLGIGPGNAAFDAAEKGDFALLKAHLGSLGAKAQGYENYIALAEQAYKKGAEENKGKVAKTVEAIHNAVGGKAQWDAIQKWASANAEPSEKAEVNAALRQGGVAAKAMAEWLAGKYAKAAGTTVEPASVLAAAAAGRESSQAGAPLTAKAYASEVQAMRQKMGYAFDGSREYQALQARRVAGQRAGM